METVTDLQGKTACGVLPLEYFILRVFYFFSSVTILFCPVLNALFDTVILFHELGLEQLVMYRSSMFFMLKDMPA